MEANDAIVISSDEEEYEPKSNSSSEEEEASVEDSLEHSPVESVTKKKKTGKELSVYSSLYGAKHEKEKAEAEENKKLLQQLVSSSTKDDNEAMLERYIACMVLSGVGTILRSC
jgi:hypothetical protein